MERYTVMGNKAACIKVSNSESEMLDPTSAFPMLYI